MEDIIIPLSICVILPIAVVLILCVTKINLTKKNTDVLLKAIEMNNTLDAEKLAKSLLKPRMNVREIRNRRLLYGCLFTLLGLGCVVFTICERHKSTEEPILLSVIALSVGLSFLIVWFVTRHDIEKDSEEHGEQ